MKKYLLVFLASLSLFAVLLAPTGASAQGNSDAAHACQQGGFEHMKRPNGTRFANTGECVRFAAQGGELLSLVPGIVVSFDPTGDPNYCMVQVDLVDFDPETTYPVTMLINGSYPYYPVMTTDETGFASSYPIGSFYNGGPTVTVISNGITVGPFPISCAP